MRDTLLNVHESDLKIGEISGCVDEMPIRTADNFE